MRAVGYGVWSMEYGGRGREAAPLSCRASGENDLKKDV